MMFVRCTGRLSVAHLTRVETTVGELMHGEADAKIFPLATPWNHSKPEKTLGNAAAGPAGRSDCRRQRKMARYLPSALDLLQRRRLTHASLLRERASRGIRAAGRRLGAQRLLGPRQRRLPESRRGVDEFARIGMRRRRQEGVGRPCLYEAAAKHHRDFLADVADDR